MKLGTSLTAILAAGLLASAPAPAASLRVGLGAGSADIPAVAASSGTLLAAPWGEGGAVDAFKLLPSPLRIGVRRVQAPSTPPEEWLVHVRKTSTRREATLIEAGLRRAVAAPLRIEQSAPSAWRIVAGPFAEREEAEALEARLRAAGMAEASAFGRSLESPPVPSRLVVITPDWTIVGVPGERLVVRATDASTPARLSWNGNSYRGDLTFELDATGSLIVANEVELEEYLRGVVPKEMGPEVYPEVEALAAQAVAARTYARAQLGRHAADGYDLCATPHCQVYGGASAEHALSDRAVEATRGLVIAHAGKLATTYYSSTCGGRTEAVENVFDSPPAAYLRSVECYPEQVRFHGLSGRRVNADWKLADGRSADQALARLVAVGVVLPAELDLSGFARRARADECLAWLERAARAAGRQLQPDAKLDIATASGFVSSIVATLGWDAEASLLAPQDLVAAAHFNELRGLDGPALVAAFIALKGGILPRGVSPGWGSDKLSRGNALEVIELWLRGTAVFETEPVRFLAGDGGHLSVYRGKERLTVDVPPTVLLLTGRPGIDASPVSSVELKLGDKLRLLGPPGGSVACLVLEEDPDGAASDRTSSWSWWTRRTPLEQLAREAQARLGLAGLTDLEVTKLSNAGRVISIQLHGAKGRTAEARGFTARQVLGLPDTRAHVTLERDPSGALTAVLATGRGWGHGVGLCQTGAFGMALAGATAPEILAHYYPGTRLVPYDSLAP